MATHAIQSPPLHANALVDATNEVDSRRSSPAWPAGSERELRRHVAAGHLPSGDYRADTQEGQSLWGLINVDTERASSSCRRAIRPAFGDLSATDAKYSEMKLASLSGAGEALKQ